MRSGIRSLRVVLRLREGDSSGRAAGNAERITGRPGIIRIRAEDIRDIELESRLPHRRQRRHFAELRG